MTTATRLVPRSRPTVFFRLDKLCWDASWNVEMTALGRVGPNYKGSRAGWGTRFCGSGAGWQHALWFGGRMKDWEKGGWGGLGSRNCALEMLVTNGLGKGSQRAGLGVEIQRWIGGDKRTGKRVSGRAWESKLMR
jgi:hypothetical protein